MGSPPIADALRVKTTRRTEATSAYQKDPGRGRRT